MSDAEMHHDQDSRDNGATRWSHRWHQGGCEVQVPCAIASDVVSLGKKVLHGETRRVKLNRNIIISSELTSRN